MVSEHLSPSEWKDHEDRRVSFCPEESVATASHREQTRTQRKEARASSQYNLQKPTPSPVLTALGVLIALQAWSRAGKTQERKILSQSKLKSSNHTKNHKSTDSVKFQICNACLYCTRASSILKCCELPCSM